MNRPAAVPVTGQLLRTWPLPSIETADSKDDRGTAVIIGGASKTPGAVLLAGLAALRVGAGKITLGSVSDVAIGLALAVPEAGVAGLPVTDDGGLGGAAVSAASELVEAADAVLVGPGMTGPDAAKEFVMGLLPAVPREATIVLDALALTCCPLETLLADRPRDRVVVTPNATETEMLLGRAGSGDGDDTAQRLAELLGVVVATGSTVAAPDGRVWRGREGNSGLGTSGSGDVLAGAVVGLAARAAPPPQAAVWAVDLHTAAGNRLASRVGPVGYLARELLDELPQVLAQLS